MKGALRKGPLSQSQRMQAPRRKGGRSLGVEGVGITWSLPASSVSLPPLQSSYSSRRFREASPPSTGRFQEGSRQGSRKVPGRFQEGSREGSRTVPGKVPRRFQEGSRKARKVPGILQDGSKGHPEPEPQVARMTPSIERCSAMIVCAYGNPTTLLWLLTRDK